MSKLIKKGKLLFKSEKFVAKGLVLATLILLISVPYAYSVKQSGTSYGYGYSGYGYGYGYADALPSAVTSLSCSAASTSSITCSWTAPTTTINSTSLDNLTGYRYTYSTSSNSTCNTGGSTLTSTSVTITGLDANTEYNVAVCAYDDIDNYSSAATSSATTDAEASTVPSGGGGASQTPTATTTVTTTGQATATITSVAGGSVATTSGRTTATAVIPAGALTTNAQVSVQAVAPSAVSAPAPSSGTFLIAGLIFNFTVDGGSATFNKPVTLNFSYSDLQIEGLNEEDLTVYQYNDDTATWEPLETTVDTVNNIVSAQTTHFSTFAIMEGVNGAISSTNIPARPATTDQSSEDQANTYFEEITGSSASSTEDKQIVYFMAYGASAESKNMSQRDRKGVITDFVDTYGRVPSTATDWSDIALILSSHRPTQRSISAEQKALIDFGKVYKRMPDFSNVYDEWALYYMAYNIRPNNRNIDSEKFSIGVFKSVYGVNPTTADDWAIMRAIAYTGAKR